MTRPMVTLERNNCGRPFVGLVEFGGDGVAVRAAVLVDAGEFVHDVIIVRRFADLVRLMGENVTSEVAAGFYPVAPVGLEQGPSGPSGS